MKPPQSSEPLVSIVTPSLNMGRLLEDTIRSVLQQDYPRIEYLVMDGGSSDETLQILRRYEGRLQFFSSPDAGQSDAVNRGFALTNGEIFAFLNADDTYLPGAVSAAVAAFADHPEAAGVYGKAWHVGEDGATIAAYPVEEFDPKKLARRCFICQPATFLRREVFAAVGMLDTNLRFALDYDFWIRLSRQYAMVKIDRFLATSRLHSGAKTVRQTGQAIYETIETLQRHFGYVPFNWLYGFGYHQMTKQPLAVEPPRADLRSAFYALCLGARYNWRHPLRYGLDILGTAKGARS